ncbi:MAG: HAD family phosphatase [Planctomycetaceae bacterium]|nr:HAD family phosphatase [Planctomycetaceae bacterium]
MPTATGVRAVVFDLDGLLVNTEELYPRVGAELLRRRGKVMTDELLHRMMGRPARVSLQIMIDEHALDATVEQLSQETAEMFPAILDAHLALMPGVVELLAALERAELPKAVATSSGIQFTRDVLERVQLTPRFAFLLTSEDVTHGKPAPEIYEKAAARLQISPRDMVVFEDSHNGCRAAVASGAIAIAVPGEHSKHHEFPGSRLVANTLRDPRVYEVLGLSAT